LHKKNQLIEMQKQSIENNTQNTK